MGDLNLIPWASFLAGTDGKPDGALGFLTSAPQTPRVRGGPAWRLRGEDFHEHAHELGGSPRWRGGLSSRRTPERSGGVRSSENAELDFLSIMTCPVA